MYSYIAYYTCKHVFNVQYVLFSCQYPATFQDEILEIAKNAVKEKYNRSDTITAIMGDGMAFIHTGNGEFVSIGE